MIENESGIDKKIITVLISKVDVFFDNIQNINYISNMVKDKTNYFFEYY